MDTTRRNLRTFYSIVATQTLSIIGSQLSGLAIGFYVFAQTGQATPLLLVSLFSMLPNIFAANIGGFLADRWDRRKLMMAADVGQAICSLFLLFSFSSGSFQLWHLYAVVIVSSTLSAVQNPAFVASITMLVPDDHRDRANAMTQITGPLAGIIAPIISGLIYGVVGVVGTIVIDLLTFLFAAAVYFFVQIPMPTRTEAGKAADAGVWQSFTAGLAFLWSRKPLFVLALQASLINFCIAGSMGMAMAYLLSRTSSEATSGLLFGLSSAGMLAGGIVISVWGGTRPRIHTIMPAIIFSGVMLILFGLSRSPLVLGFTFTAMLFPLSWANAPIMSILQAKVPPDMQGRVFAVLSQMAMVLTPLAYLLYGHLADNVLEPAVGTASWAAVAPLVGDTKGAGMAVIFVVAGLLMAVSSALIYALPLIRNMEATLPDYTAAPVEAAEPDIEGAVVPATGD